MIQLRLPQLTVFESALFCTTSTVIATPDFVLLVDPTWLPHEVEEIRSYVKKIRRGRPLYLLFTHSDYDHIIGWRAVEDAITIASKAFVENPQREEMLQEIKKFDATYYIHRDYPILYPTIDVVVTEDGQQLTIGVTTLTFYLAPGHNADGIFTIVEPLGVWIAGDYLSNVEFPYIYHSSYEYERTLAKTQLILERHSIRWLIPGHGDVATSTEEILNRFHESLEYIHSLRQAVQAGTPFDEERLWQRYAFKGGMLNYHLENIALLEKEWKNSAKS